MSLLSMAQSSPSDWLAVQDYYQAQAEKVLKIYDDEAKLIVQIVARPPTENLPGTSLTMSHPGTLADDIDRVNVTVFSNQDSMDSTFQETMSAAINVDAKKIKISMKKPKIIPKPVVKTAYDGIKEMQVSAEAGFDRFMTMLMFGIGGFGFVIFSLGLLDFFSKRKGFAALVEGIKSAASQTGGAMNPTSPMPIRRPELDFDLSKSTQTAAMGHAMTSSSQRIRLSNESLVEFFADCYWTQNEAWAHRAWLHLSTDQKKHLLSALDFFEEYVGQFIQVTPAELQESNPWNDISYLNPSSIKFVSQTDLWKAVQADRQLWWNLSEMRQSSFNLTLKDRTELLTVKRVKKTIPNLAKSLPRIFKAQLQMKSLTVEDEKYLLGQLSTIASEYRKDLPSLVWLKLLPDTEIQKIFENIDAKTTSQALAGPPEFISWVTKYIPEKKMNLVRSYQEKALADRSSYSFLYVFQLVIKKIDELERAKQNAPTKNTTSKVA